MFVQIKKLCWLMLLISLWVPSTVKAASGTPNSPNFGYGARVYLNGENPQAAIQAAGNFNFDWIAFDLDWQQIQPDANQEPYWNQLDQAMMVAAENQISVLLSVTRAPAWAMNENGPAPQQTADLAAQLAHRYAGTLLALELFPSANTIQGWGAQPDPQAYTDLLKATAQAVGQGIFLVGAGLTPLSSASEGMDDVEFLHQLYAAGAEAFMPIVGLRLPAIGADPLTPRHQAEGLPLRHYESIHNIMVENEHHSGLLWVTGFSWDSNSLGDIITQADWLKQAYLLMRSQLYIGAAFFDGLNSAQAEATVLFHPGEAPHPGFDNLVQLIALDNNRQTIEISLTLSKKISYKNYSKGG